MTFNAFLQIVLFYGSKNTLAYFGQKSFNRFGPFGGKDEAVLPVGEDGDDGHVGSPGVNVIKLFLSIIYDPISVNSKRCSTMVGSSLTLRY